MASAKEACCPPDLFVATGKERTTVQSPIGCKLCPPFRGLVGEGIRTEGGHRETISGDPLRAGEIVSSGTLTAGHPMEKENLWTAELEGISVPSLTVKLE